jgi:hypothetical protein
MDIDITRLVEEVELFDLSASIAERGPNAGPETWKNSMAEASEHPLLTADQLDAARDYFREFGAWDDEEIDAWSPEEVNAMVVQYVAGNLREIEALCMGDDGEIDWDKVEELDSAGRISGSIYRADDRVWFQMDH